MSVHIEELQCWIHRAEFDFDLNRAILTLPYNNSTDGRGAIAWVRRIMPDVERISVFCGHEIDVEYRRMSKADSKWETRDMR